MSNIRLSHLMLCVVIMAFVASILVSAPAKAEGACCGRVKNASHSDKWLAIGQGWTYVKYKQTLRPGMSSTHFYKDADAVYIPSGCRGAFTAPGKSLTWKSGGRWYEVKPLTWPYQRYGWTVQVVC